MGARNFHEKTVFRIAVFLCIFSIASASTSPGCEHPGNSHSGHMEIIGLDTRDFSRCRFFGLSLARPEKFGYPTPDASPRTTYVSGEVTASWYGPRHHNKRTASGKRFDMYKNTLAHKTLPLGTRVRLVNLDNGKSAEGVVNDRGPYIKGRDVDLSYAMARQLGFVKKGVAKLDIEMIYSSCRVRLPRA